MYQTRTRLSAALGALLPLILCAPAGQAAPSGTITLSASGAPISPSLYGINYVWNAIPSDRYAKFRAIATSVTHYTFARYPGGWDGERLDWDQNIETQKAPSSPGADAETFLAATPGATFMAPSQPAVANPAKIPELTSLSARLVARYGQHVTVWEVGNEWWLQGGAKKNSQKRERNLRNYAAYLASVVPAMKQANPNAQIYVTADWAYPDQFAQLRALTGPAAWADVTGIAVHAYCGWSIPDRTCALLPSRIAQARQAAGKTPVYDSEWGVGKMAAPNNFGIQDAIYVMRAFPYLVQAGVQMAAYWPPAKSAPFLALLSGDCSAGYATGYLFGWMQHYYEGTALTASGDLPAVAARDNGQVTVFVAAPGNSSQPVSISLTGTGLHRLVSAQVMFAAQPEDSTGEGARRVTIADLPVAVSGDAATFTLNPGTAGRGAGYEIARVTLQ